MRGESITTTITTIMGKFITVKQLLQTMPLSP